MTPALDGVKRVLGRALQLGERAAHLSATTPLLGNLPELDSIAVELVLTELEAHFGITILDEEVKADLFATVGALARFVDGKRAQAAR